jgi:hypothetical protein
VSLLLSALQVKELGIYFADCPQLAKTVEVYFQNLLTLSTLNSTNTITFKPGISSDKFIKRFHAGLISYSQKKDAGLHLPL